MCTSGDTHVSTEPKMQTRDFSDDIERSKLRAQSIQYIFDLDPRTLLTLDQIAPAIGRTVLTVRTNASRRPKSLPKITEISGNLFVKVSDLLKFMEGGRDDDVQTSAAPSKPRRGRPTNAERQARAAGQLAS